VIVLAVLLLIAVALAVLFILVTGTTEHLTLAWDQVNLSWATTALVVFLAGAVTLLVAEIGVGLLLRGNRRSWARRKELKRLRRVEQERSRTPTGVRPTAPASGTTPTSAPSTASAPHGGPTGTDGGAGTRRG
jgi:uncharacterized membrane-anchored protein